MFSKYWVFRETNAPLIVKEVFLYFQWFSYSNPAKRFKKWEGGINEKDFYLWESSASPRLNSHLDQTGCCPFGTYQRIGWVPKFLGQVTMKQPLWNRVSLILKRKIYLQVLSPSLKIVQHEIVFPSTFQLKDSTRRGDSDLQMTFEEFLHHAPPDYH